MSYRRMTSIYEDGYKEKIIKRTKKQTNRMTMYIMIKKIKVWFHMC